MRTSTLAAMDTGAGHGTALDSQLLRILGCFPDPLIVKDVASRYVFANGAAAKLLSVETPEALLGKTDFDFYSSERASLFQEEDLVVRTGHTVRSNAQAVADQVSGKLRWLRCTKAPFLDSGDNIVGVLVVVTEVSESQVSTDGSAGASADNHPPAAQAELEEALERERALLRTMIDSIPAKIYAKDAQSRFIACNWAVARDMGTTPDQLVGQTDAAFFPRAMAEAFLADEQAVLRSDQALIGREEPMLDRVTGAMRLITTTKVPLRDKSGKLTSPHA